jgi:pimeloyl-ACP methyl ester carboxylesterase
MSVEHPARKDGSDMLAMRTILIVAALVLGIAPPVAAQDLVGDWRGTLKAGAAELRLVLHVVRRNGELSATLDSIDQGANGIPVTSIALKGTTVTFVIESIQGSYEGRINTEGTAIDGMWSQAGAMLPLMLERAKGAASLQLRRPQHPVKPYPYREEEVTYRNQEAGFSLAGTLTVPAGKGPFPAVVLITGSGAQDRDESLMGHRPFLVLSDHLTRHGIAVLRADDRGVGKSGGSFASATTADFATDVEAAVAYLQSRSEIDRRKIGLVGHSEGGVIAPMIAARRTDVAYIVLMAGTGVPGDEIIVAQSVLIAQASGLSREQAERNGALQKELLTLVRQEQDATVLEQKLRQRLGGSIPEAQLGAQIKAVTGPWYRYFIAYDPGPALKQVRCPVLVLNGELDLQVPPKQNLPAIRAALEAGGNKSFEIVEFPGLNHLFQSAKTGGVAEYAQIEETIAPAVLEKISAWILER